MHLFNLQSIRLLNLQSMRSVVCAFVIATNLLNQKPWQAFFALFTPLVWDAKGQRSLCELGITLLLSHLPVVIAICVGVNTTARGRCFKIGQTLSTHLSLQFMLSTYVGMLLLRLLFHFWMSGNEELVPFEGPLPKFLMSCSRLCRFASSLSQHLS